MRILLVDDSRAVASVIGARLTTIGHEVIVAENGEVAVARFRDARPDLLLMDIEMPVMNGFEAAERIRALEANEDCAWTPIIFLTASDTPENLVTAIEAGGDDFIAKSVPEAVLEAKMKAMARIASLRAELSRANRKLASLANCDGLTGLFNRRHMDACLDVQWAQATRIGASFGLLMLDVDHFKLYNDHYGHQAGDDCLRAIARILADVCEKANGAGLVQGAFAARYGGGGVLDDPAVCVAGCVCPGGRGGGGGRAGRGHSPCPECGFWGGDPVPRRHPDGPRRREPGAALPRSGQQAL